MKTMNAYDDDDIDDDDDYLQVLNVRHNGITAISGFTAQDIPRLRKLILSENRIPHDDDGDDDDCNNNKKKK